MSNTWMVGLGLLLGTSVLAGDDLSVVARVEQAMFGDHRSASNIERNRYRHPVGTLTFFGLEEGMTVMEIWPGAGWYTEILAPAIRDRGTFIVAGYDVDVAGQPDYRYRLQKQLLDKFAQRPDLYDQVQVVPFSPPQSASLGAAASVDMILTFRSAHGWIEDGLIEPIFAEFYRVLKPGGVVGIVQHRAAPDASVASAEQGYVSERAMVELAQRAGFRLDASSEVNANPKDPKNHPRGVWTLPPSLRLGEQDREHYLAIGESDRMTLRLHKPLD